MSSTLYGVPKSNVSGDSATSWHPFTVDISAVTTAPVKGTIVIDSAFWRREHQTSPNIVITWNYRQSAAGNAGSGTYLFSLPPGFHMALSLIPGPNGGISAPATLGYAYLDTSGSPFTGLVIPYGTADSTRFLILVIEPSSTTAYVDNSVFNLGNTNVYYSITATIPVLEYVIN